MKINRTRKINLERLLSSKSIFWFGIITAGLLILIVIFPLLSSGYIPTHDGEYHIIRFMDFYRMISQGNLFPRWAPTMNSGYGIPIFNFHYPFPNYTGIILHLIGFQFVDAFKLSLALAYILSLIFSYIWLKIIFGKKAALTGSLIAAFIPYWFVDIYVRGSIGEVWSVVFLLLAFVSIEYNIYILLIISVALLILSHNIMAMIMLPIICLYIILRRKQMINYVIPGLLLTAYFWLPALVEKKYVVGLNTVDFTQYFADIPSLLMPSWGTGFPGSQTSGNIMSIQIGIIPIIIFFIGFILLINEGNVKLRNLIMFFFGLLIISIFLMLKVSVPIWSVFTILQYIQYPWRLLTLIIPITALICAYLIYKSNKIILACCLILLSYIISFQYFHPVIYEQRSDAYYQNRVNFTDGTSSMGNSFSTVWSNWKQNRSVGSYNLENGLGHIEVLKNNYTYKKYQANMTTDAIVSFPILYYPGWTVYIDSKPTKIDYRLSGILIVNISKGRHDIEIVFQETQIRIFADLISLVTLGSIISYILYKYTLIKNYSK
jgi:hypothetical protein